MSEEGVRIDALTGTINPSPEHEFPAMRNGQTVKLTVAQVMALARAFDGAQSDFSFTEETLGAALRELGDNVVTKAGAEDVALALAEKANIDDVASGLAEKLDKDGSNVGDAAAKATFLDNIGVEWEFIGEATPSNAADIRFTDLDTFEAIRLEGFLRPATDNNTLMLRTSTNNGASFDAGASDYVSLVVAAASSSVVASTQTGTGNLLSVNTGVGSAAGRGISFNVYLERFNKLQPMFGMSESSLVSGAGTLRKDSTSLRRDSSTARNALQILFSAGGNIAGGVVKLYGRRG